MNPTAALQGEALYALLEQARDLLHDYGENRHTTIQPQERMAAAAELLNQQPLAPASADELELLHDFWLKLEQPATANAALQQHGGHTGVWRVQDGGLAFVPVNTGAQGLDGTVLITPAGSDTLARGDRVVLYSQGALQPDTRIRVVEQLLPAGGAK